MSDAGTAYSLFEPKKKSCLQVAEEATLAPKLKETIFDDLGRPDQLSTPDGFAYKIEDRP